MISFYGTALHDTHIQIVCIINIMDKTSELCTYMCKTKFWRTLC